jgi:hypothetical protein
MRGVILLAVLAGCASDYEVALGMASTDGKAYVELVDGDEADLVPGAQGGFHVWLKVRVRGVAGMGTITVEREARRVSDGELVLGAVPQHLEVPADTEDGWWEKPEPMPAFMCPTPIGLRVEGEPIRLTVRLRTEDGELLAEDHAIVVPRCRPDQQGEYCLEICIG